MILPSLVWQKAVCSLSPISLGKEIEWGRFVVNVETGWEMKNGQYFRPYNLEIVVASLVAFQAAGETFSCYQCFCHILMAKKGVDFIEKIDKN